MEQERVWLKPALSRGKGTGDYECSLCGHLFRPTPSKPFNMPLIFGLHAGALHPGAKLSRERNHFGRALGATVSNAPENE